MSESAVQIDNEGLMLAEALVDSMRAGDQSEADRLIFELTRTREQSMFQEVGKLTRQIHEAINSFSLDERLANLAGNEIPDAKERLNHVIDLTAQSADTTLTAVESAIPLAEQIQSEAKDLRAQTDSIHGKPVSDARLGMIFGQVQEFMDQVQDKTGEVQSQLNEILMAQEFQDLTGQIIRRVITMVGDVEASLVELVRVSGTEGAVQSAADENPEEISKGVGPAVPGTEGSNERLTSQDDVDDLLSSLGF